MALKTLDDAFLEHLAHTLDAERQMENALPKMQRQASSNDLASAFEEHLAETRGQANRLEQVFQSLGKEPHTTTCPAMRGLISAAEEMAGHDAEAHVHDALLIAAAQKIEHYEIASYGALCVWSEILGHDEATKLLKQSISEEKEADEKLKQLAKSINKEAVPA